MDKNTLEQNLRWYRDWLQRLVDDSQGALDRKEESEHTLAMHTAWEVALRTFDMHFPHVKEGGDS